MHVYFSGIGGSGASSIAMMAKQAGYRISGSDMQASSYTDYLKKHGMDDLHIGQSEEQIAAVQAKHPIDCFVYTSALPMADPRHPELEYCRRHNIPTLKHDEFLSQFIKDKNLKLIAIAGTHGKSTTTAMVVWLFKQLGLPVSYCLGAKIGFGEIGAFDPDGSYFVYEADEFDRKFLSFYPHVALISGLDWDHPDIYPTRESYYEAFSEFLSQSTHAVLWHDDAEKLGLTAGENRMILDDKDPDIGKLKLRGLVNRQDAWLVAQGLSGVLGKEPAELIKIVDDFPGLSRRFEEITAGLFSDYAHTPPKIRGALQLAHETAGDHVVVVYEGLHNTRQHFIKDELPELFEGVQKLYIVPSYLAREDPSLKLLTPADLRQLLKPDLRQHTQVFDKLDDNLKHTITRHLAAGDLVLALSAGGAGSLDEWLRQHFAS